MTFTETAASNQIIRFGTVPKCVVFMNASTKSCAMRKSQYSRTCRAFRLGEIHGAACVARNPNVKPETRTRVQKGAEELGYSLDAYFSNLSSRHRKSGNSKVAIAYISRRLEPSPEGNYPKGNVKALPYLREVAEKRGYKLDFYNPDEFSSVTAMLRQIWTNGTAGLLIYSITEADAKALCDFGKLPMLSLLRESFLPIQTVRFSNSQALRLCWQKLSACGYSRIGCATMQNREVLLDDLQREAAALGQYANAGQTHPCIPPLKAKLDDITAYRSWLKKHRPEAVIGYNARLFYESYLDNGARPLRLSLHANEGATRMSLGP